MEYMGTGTLCREADKSVPVPMCVTDQRNFASILLPKLKQAIQTQITAMPFHTGKNCARTYRLLRKN